MVSVFLLLVKVPCCLLYIDRFFPAAFAALGRFEEPFARMGDWIEARMEGNLGNEAEVEDTLEAERA
jgi:hypothetical protein